MPNTKSAIRRTRSNERKRQRNQSVKSRLKTLERRFQETVKAGKKEEAAEALRQAISSFDKAAKGGVIHSGMANRKKSRLSSSLAGLK